MLMILLFVIHTCTYNYYLLCGWTKQVTTEHNTHVHVLCQARTGLLLGICLSVTIGDRDSYDMSPLGVPRRQCKLAALGVWYHRSGFNCEVVIIVNCEFWPPRNY